MKRVIKFRAWDDGKMFYQYDKDEFTIYNIEKLFKKITGVAVLMQYTGLKDKCGVEIYEGDSVYIDDDYEKYGWAAGSTAKVTFRTGKFLMEDNAGRYYFETNSDVQDGVKVLGNVFENPELLTPTASK